MMSDVQILIKKCEDLIEILQNDDSAGVDHWVKWFAQSISYLKELDVYGCRKILDAYGGMGSFNDVSLPDATNETKRKHLSTEIYEIAQKLIKENNANH